MAFFRTYLVENGQTPEFSFSEDDEAALVLFLLYARLNRSARDVRVPADFAAPENIPEELSSSEAQDALKFITVFLCFFVSKPGTYMRDMENFKEYFIPNFARSTDKQIQLGESVHKEFFTATIEDITRSTTLGRFMDITKIPVIA